MKAPKQQTTASAAKTDKRQSFLQRKPAERPFVSQQHSPPIQPKLAVNQPGDRYEQEADRMAERVMRSPAPGAAPPMISRMHAGAPAQQGGAGIKRQKSVVGSLLEEYKNNISQAASSLVEKGKSYVKERILEKELEQNMPQSIGFFSFLFRNRMREFKEIDSNNQRLIANRNKYIEEEIFRINFWLEKNKNLTDEEKANLEVVLANLMLILFTPLSLDPLFDPYKLDMKGLECELSRIVNWLENVDDPNSNERLSKICDNIQVMMLLYKDIPLSKGSDREKTPPLTYYLVNSEISKKALSIFAFGDESFVDAFVGISDYATLDTLIPGQVIKINSPPGIDFTALFNESTLKTSILTHGEVFNENTSEIGQEVILGGKRFAIPSHLFQIFLNNYFRALKQKMFYAKNDLKRSIDIYKSFKSGSSVHKAVSYISDKSGGASFSLGQANNYLRQADELYKQIGFIHPIGIEPELINDFIPMYEKLLQWNKEVDTSLLSYFGNTVKGAAESIQNLYTVRDVSLATSTAVLSGKGYAEMVRAGVNAFKAALLVTSGAAYANARVRGAANFAGQLAFNSGPVDLSQTKDEALSGFKSGLVNASNAVATAGIANFLGQGKNIIDNAWRGLISGSAGGFVAGAGGSALEGKSFWETLKAGKKGAISGAVGGGIGGGSTFLLNNPSALVRFVTGAGGGALGTWATGGGLSDIVNSIITGGVTALPTGAKQQSPTSKSGASATHGFFSPTNLPAIDTGVTPQEVFQAVPYQTRSLTSKNLGPGEVSIIEMIETSPGVFHPHWSGQARSIASSNFLPGKLLSLNKPPIIDLPDNAMNQPDVTGLTVRDETVDVAATFRNVYKGKLVEEAEVGLLDRMVSHFNDHPFSSNRTASGVELYTLVRLLEDPNVRTVELLQARNKKGGQTPDLFVTFNDGRTLRNEITTFNRKIQRTNNSIEVDFATGLVSAIRQKIEQGQLSNKITGQNIKGGTIKLQDRDDIVAGGRLTIEIAKELPNGVNLDTMLNHAIKILNDDKFSASTSGIGKANKSIHGDLGQHLNEIEIVSGSEIRIFVRSDNKFVKPKDNPIIQPKLAVNQPGDRYEQEADRMAERVMRSPAPGAAPPMISRMHAGGPVQRQCAACAAGGTTCADCAAEENELGIQRRAAKAEPTHAPDDLAQRLEQRKGQGAPLPPALHEHMGEAFQSDFSNVRLHTDPEAAAMSRDLNAQAFTHGQDIYFDAGKYQPGTTAGRGLLGHELTHTVQQGHAPAGVQRQPNTGTSGTKPGLLSDKELIHRIVSLKQTLREPILDTKIHQQLKSELLHLEAESYLRPGIDRKLLDVPAPLPKSLTGELVLAALDLRQLMDEDQLIRLYLGKYNPTAEERMRLQHVLDNIAMLVRFAGAPPGLWGVYTDTEDYFLSVAYPGAAVSELAVYLYGDEKRARDIVSANFDVSGFLSPGHIVMLPSPRQDIPLTQVAKSHLEHATLSGMVIQQASVSEAAEDVMQIYQFEVGGRVFKVTDAQLSAMMRGAAEILKAKYKMYDDIKSKYERVKKDFYKPLASFSSGFLSMPMAIPMPMMYLPSWPLAPVIRLSVAVAPLEQKILSPAILAEAGEAFYESVAIYEQTAQSWNTYVKAVQQGTFSQHLVNNDQSYQVQSVQDLVLDDHMAFLLAMKKVLVRDLGTDIDPAGNDMPFDAAVSSPDDLVSIDNTHVNPGFLPTSTDQTAPRSLSETAGFKSYQVHELQEEAQRISGWLARHPDAAQSDLLLQKQDQINRLLRFVYLPPVYFGEIDLNQGNMRYFSVVFPGYSLEDVALYLFGDPAAKYKIASPDSNLPDFLEPGKILLVELETIAVIADQNGLRQIRSGNQFALANQAASPNANPYAVETVLLGDEMLMINEHQKKGLALGRAQYIKNEMNNIRNVANGLFNTVSDHILGTDMMVRGISDTLGGASLNDFFQRLGEIHDLRADALLALAYVDSELTLEHTIEAEKLLLQSRALEEKLTAEFKEYFEDTVAGAGIAVTVLEITKDLAFAYVTGRLAIGLAKWAHTAYKLGRAATAAVGVSSGATIGAGLRGGSSALGQYLADGNVSWDTTKGELYKGAIEGSFSFLGELATPHVQRFLMARLFGKAGPTVIRVGVNAGMGGLENAATQAAQGLPDLMSGKKSTQDYLKDIGWDALTGVLLTGGIDAGSAGLGAARKKLFGKNDHIADLSPESDAIVNPLSGEVTQYRRDVNTGDLLEIRYNPGSLSGKITNITQGRSMDILNGKPRIPDDELHIDTDVEGLAKAEVAGDGIDGLSSRQTKQLEVGDRVDGDDILKPKHDTILDTEMEVVQAAVAQGKASPSQLAGYEIEVMLPNSHHIWRRTPEGHWCRYSDEAVCFMFNPGSVDSLIHVTELDAKGTSPGDEIVTLFHGTNQEGLTGLDALGNGNISVTHGSDVQDFGQGFYMSQDVSVAVSSANARGALKQGKQSGGGMRHVLQFDIRRQDLGVIVDVQRNGAHRAAWDAFLDQSYIPGIHGMATRREFLAGLGIEKRGELFEEFLESINMKHADVIIGPIGDPVTSGMITSALGESTQTVIRSQRVADVLNSMMRSKDADIKLYNREAFRGKKDYQVFDPKKKGRIITDIDDFDVQGNTLWENKSATSGIDRASGRDKTPKWIRQHITEKFASYLEARKHLSGFESAAIGFHFETSGVDPVFRAAVEAEIVRLRAAHPDVEIKLKWD